MLDKAWLPKSSAVNIRIMMKRLAALIVFAVFSVAMYTNIKTLQRDTWNPCLQISQDFTGSTNVTKQILLYTTLLGKSWLNIPENPPPNYLSTLNCTVSNCVVTYDKNLLPESNAVLFHASDMPNANHLRHLRKTRCLQRQRWGYLTFESPENSPDPTPLHGLFNLTLTYKKNSDVWVPYSKYVPLSDGEERPDTRKNYAANKHPGAAWIVSHCGLLRQKYVLKLQEMYPVHVGGGCKKIYKKKMPCERDCFRHIHKYKFYLAFENGFCQEYITEKYWWNALMSESVPIVMGAGPYDNEEYGAIPGSFINVKDFKTIRELAKYLHYLDKNDHAYNRYFKWKQKYKLIQPSTDWPFPNIMFCEICKIIQRADYPAKVVDLTSFWGRDFSCFGHDKEVKSIIMRSL